MEKGNSPPQSGRKYTEVSTSHDAIDNDTTVYLATYFTY